MGYFSGFGAFSWNAGTPVPAGRAGSFLAQARKVNSADLRLVLSGTMFAFLGCFACTQVRAALHGIVVLEHIHTH